MTTSPAWLTPIRLPMSATLGTINVYLIKTDNGAALIDTGIREAAGRRELEQALGEKGLVFSDIAQVFLTHHHVDHVGLAAEFQDAGAEVTISTIDEALLTNFHDRPEQDIERARLFADHPLPEEMTVHVEKTFAFMRKLGRKSVPDRCVNDGDEIELAQKRFQIIAAPGHTPGHLILKQSDENVWFSGDALLTPSATHISGRNAEGEDPFADYIRTLKKIGASDATVYPGHGRPIANPQKRAAALITHLTESLAQTKSLLDDRPKFAFDLCENAQDPRSRHFPKWLAFSQTVAMLDHLVKIGQARKEMLSAGIGYRRWHGHTD